MTVNYSFDLEDDDLLDDTFRSIPENDLLSYSISGPTSENLSINNELNTFQASGPSKAFENSSIIKENADRNRKSALSFLSKSRESTLVKQKDIGFSEICSPNKSINTDETTKINSRFVPGFTPKAKKRKLPGPAGFFSENDDQHFQPVDSEHLITKGTTSDIEIQNITNSQFSSEDLLHSSWQNLQANVSSCHSLLSTAKYYSIRRVLHETSKKKLPKHLVVPVLCVLIKKFNAEESSFVFLDDTGEMSGKIDKEVLDMYKEVIQERTALILKRVTCICNILILKKQNLVSIYREDGSVRHIQDLNSILDKEEPLKPMNCQCPGTPDEQAIKKPSFSNFCNSTPLSAKKTINNSHKTSKKIMPSPCPSAKGSKENSNNKNSTNSLSCTQGPIGKEKVLNILEAMMDVSKSGSSSGETLKPVDQSASSSNEICNANNNSNLRQKDDTVNKPSFAQPTWEEDLFCEDTDDFDDILCSLDEKSFLQEM